jgi:hypothetical protein
MWQSRIYRVSRWSKWQYMHACMHAWALFIDPSSIHGSWSTSWAWATPWEPKASTRRQARSPLCSLLAFASYTASARVASARPVVGLDRGNGAGRSACCVLPLHACVAGGLRPSLHRRAAAARSGSSGGDDDDNRRGRRCVHALLDAWPDRPLPLFLAHPSRSSPASSHPLTCTC